MSLIDAPVVQGPDVRKPYRVILKRHRETVSETFTLSRHAGEDDARDAANKAVLGLPAGLRVEIWIGRGRNATKLYAVIAR